MNLSAIGALALGFAFIKLSVWWHSHLLPRHSVRLIYCHDGDTCHVENEEGKRLRVRLAGLDAPEMPLGVCAGQAMADQSKAFLENLLKEKTLQLKVFETDRFGRLVAEIQRGSENINLTMLAQGWAEVGRILAPGLNQAEYLRSMERAKAANAGVWALRDYQSPEQLRWQRKRSRCQQKGRARSSD